MKYSILLLVIFTSQLSQTLQTQAGDWPLENIQDTLIVRGTANIAAGAVGQCLVLDGESLVELKDSAELASDSFTVSLWFNPYNLAGGQQMLAGKNRYSKNERQWSLTIESDGKLKAHLQHGGWFTITRTPLNTKASSTSVILTKSHVANELAVIPIGNLVIQP